MQALADFDGDGYIFLEDLQQAGEECFEVAAELEAGPRSALVQALTAISALLHGRKVRVWQWEESACVEGAFVAVCMGGRCAFGGG